MCGPNIDLVQPKKDKKREIEEKSQVEINN